ncbi:MAG: hypothetical protein M3R50_06095 [Bacteroidota bacterium]|nr:hypothetical protein [Bacteroidota bacterium]
MKEGKIIQQGTPETIYHQPENEYVAGLFGRYNLLKPQVAVLFGFESNGKDVMTRPENFKLSTTGSGVNGIIKKINFQGSFYQAEVLIDDVIIIVHLAMHNFFEGKKVFVNINK